MSPQIDLYNLSNLDIPLSSVTRTRVYEQSFEDGTSDLTAYNCSQEVQDDVVYSGRYALRVTIPAGETGYVETPTRPVSPGQLVTFSFVHKEDANITEIRLGVVWRRSGGGIIAVDEFVLDLSSEWSVISRTIMAPKNAVSMAIRMYATASVDGDGTVYLDDITMDLVGIVVRTDGAGRMLIAIGSDDVGIAREDTLQSILSRLDVSLGTRASEDTVSLIASRLYNADEMKSITDIIRELRDKYRSDKGIAVYSEPMLVFSDQYTVSVAGVETEVLDLTNMRYKMIFLINEHDVDVYVDILTGYSVENVNINVRDEPIHVPAKSVRVAVSTRDILRYIRARIYSDLNPSEGYFAIVVLGYSL